MVSSPLTQPFFKTPILRNSNNGGRIWNRTRKSSSSALTPPLRRRLAGTPPCPSLPPPLLRLPPPPPQLLHCSFLSNPPLPPLFQHPSSPMSSFANPTSPDIKTVRVVVKGRVQGVFYRNWTVENAKELDLRGWVRNRRDGSVEALFSGSPDKVQEMEQRCRRGPPAAMVTGFKVSPCNEDPGTGFECIPTI